MVATKRNLILALITVLTAMPVTVLTSVRPPTAHAELPAPVIVSLNFQTGDPNYPRLKRPQVWQGVFDGVPNVNAPIYVRWMTPEGLYGISIGGSKKYPHHLGVSTGLNSRMPGTEERDIDGYYGPGTSFGGGAEVDVRDLVARPDGTITRFDMTFKLTQATPSGTVFGQIRYGIAEAGPVLASANRITWPTVNRFATPVVATDAFRNVSAVPVRLGQAAVRGGAFKDYEIAADGCSGVTLAPGASCELDVWFAPTASGPRVSSLILPVNGVAVPVDLTGSAPQGVDRLVVSGPDENGRDYTARYRNLMAFASRNVSRAGTVYYTYRFVDDPWPPRVPGYQGQFRLDLYGPGAPTPRGTHPLQLEYTGFALFFDGTRHLCAAESGSEAVRAMAVDQDGQPTYAVVDFVVKCAEWQGLRPTLVGQLRYQDRTDIVPPAPPTSLRSDGRRVAWNLSTSRDLRTTIVRVAPGTKITPTSGLPVSVGAARSGVLPTLVPGQRYTVAAFSVDTSGNVSNAARLSIVG